MFFYIQVGMVTALALWDPGAEVTLMKTSIFNQVKNDALGPVNPAPVALSQACGAPVKDVKQTHFKLNIAGQVGLSSVFICPSTAHDMIIGMPDINRFHISYCSWERKLIFPGQANLKIKTSQVIKGGKMGVHQFQHPHHRVFQVHRRTHGSERQRVRFLDVNEHRNPWAPEHAVLPR